MSFTIVIFLVVLPVLAICALAIYLGMGGIEHERKARKEKRKSIENELIWNGLWKLVGANAATLDKVICFLLEDQRVSARMSDEERMKKLALMREYRDVAREDKRRPKNTIPWRGAEWKGEIWGDKPIVGLDEPLNYDPQGWIAGLPFNIDK